MSFKYLRQKGVGVVGGRFITTIACCPTWGLQGISSPYLHTSINFEHDGILKLEMQPVI